MQPKNKKRILIITETYRDQIEIEESIKQWVKENLQEYQDKVDIEKYSGLDSSGALIGGSRDVLIIFDRRVCSQREERVQMEFLLENKREERTNLGRLKKLFEVSKQYCDNNQIPYVLYGGEIRLGQENDFYRKIIEVKTKMLARLALEPKQEPKPKTLEDMFPKGIKLPPNHS